MMAEVSTDPTTANPPVANPPVAGSTAQPPSLTRKVSTFSQYRVLLRKDLRMEMRTREMVTSMVLYALLVLTVYGAALSQTGNAFSILQMSSGLLWAVIIFTSLLGLNRSFSHEKENGCLEGLLLVPMDRAVIFLAKMTSNLIFLVFVEVITVPLFYFFFISGQAMASTYPLAIWPLLVGTVGVAGVGTLLATMTVNTRGKDVILAVLFIPLIFPLLYACVAATSVVVLGSDDWFHTYWQSLLLAGGYDVIMILAAYALYGFVLDV